ncbi:hypothetical protein K492DRAFT_172083 [Lichtheimia hyalospora FSU 10163]|nr:hypothetical protein K492DRAFT_172083 [Lichtheimia hyalospora FSU 10163]
MAAGIVLNVLKDMVTKRLDHSIKSPTINNKLTSRFTAVQEIKTVGRRLSAISDRFGQGKQDPYAWGDRILFCHDYICSTMVSEWTEANLNETSQKLDR